MQINSNQLTQLYDFSLFIKCYRHDSGYKLKEIASDFGIDQSKFNRIENNRIPHDLKFEKRFLEYFNINLNKFLEVDRFYTDLYNELLDDVILLEHRGIYEKISNKIHNYKNKSSLFSPMEYIILFVSSRFDDKRRNKERVKLEKKYINFIDKHLEYYNYNVQKIYLCLKALYLENMNKYKEAFSLITYVQNNLPAGKKSDCVIYSYALFIGNDCSFHFPASEYYYVGKDICLQYGSIKRMIHLGLNYASYLRNIKSYHEALKIDLYYLKIANQLKEAETLIASLEYNLGLDYQNFKDYETSYYYFDKTLPFFNDGDSYFQVIYTLYHLERYDELEKIYLESKSNSNIDPLNQDKIDFIYYLYFNQDDKCEDLIKHMLENHYSALSLQDKKALLLYIEEYYESKKNEDKLLKYIQMENELNQL